MLDFQHANNIALSHFRSWIPGGEMIGDEYTVRNPTRSDKTPGSFKINCRTGKWIENASGEGGDLVSLRAYIDGSSQKDAFEWIISEYDPMYFPPVIDSRKTNKNPGDYWSDFRYCHKGCKDPPELNTKYYQKKFGEEVERWPFHIQVSGEWRVVMWIVRFSDGQKKADRPFTLWSNGNEHKWRCKAPDGKYPLYGLRDLTERPNAPILLAEGQKAPSRAKDILTDYVCCGWYGGALSIEKSDLDQLRGREVWFMFDADAPGRAVLKILKNLDVKIHPVHPPLNVPGGWDIADAIADGWSREKIEEWILDSANVPDKPKDKKLAVRRDWEIQDYLEPTKLHRIFLDEKCGENSYFVHNETGYMWNGERKHWQVYPVNCMIEEFQQWALCDNGELVRIAEMNNSGTIKASEKIYPEIIMGKSIGLLKRYRGPDIMLGGENPFSNLEGVKPHWHFRNGMLEIAESGAVWYPREDHPESFFMSTWPLGCMEFDYDPEKKDAPCFMSTVRRLVPDGYKDDAQGLKFILQCFGYSLMPRKMKPYYFICHGKQGSGKSSLLQVLKELAGGYFINKRMQEVFSQFGKPGLVGKLVVCDDDISDDYILPTAIKTLMANSELTIEEKGKPQYQAVMNLAPWIIGNRPPKITGSDGHDRRAIVMHFSNTEKGDPLHMDKMFGRVDGSVDERPAIMNMVLNELQEFVKTWEFDSPGWATDAHREWITTSNSVASYFSENRDPKTYMWYPRTAVYRHYAIWSELSGMRPVSSDVFYKSMDGENIETRKYSGIRQIKCPFILPSLDTEELRMLKTNQESQNVYHDEIPF